MTAARKTVKRTVKKQTKTARSSKPNTTVKQMGSSAANKAQVLKTIKKFTDEMYDKLKKGEYPAVELKSRSTNNIIYSKKLGQYVLGDRVVKRSSGTLDGARPFFHLMWMASKAQEAQVTGMLTSKRNVFYESINDPLNNFKDQMESDKIIDELEVALGISKEEMGIVPKESNSIFGDMTINFRSKDFVKPVNPSDIPLGMTIDNNIADAKIKLGKNAKSIIVLEKHAVYATCIQAGIAERFNAILIEGSGQAARATRRILHRLATEFKLPVYVFCDGDPSGMHIAAVYLDGSAASAYQTGLTAPNAKWCGIWGTEVSTFPVRAMIPFKDQDIARCKSMIANDPRYSVGIWKREVKEFLKLKKKVELEAFAAKGNTFFTEEYLPKKIADARKGKF